MKPPSVGLAVPEPRPSGAVTRPRWWQLYFVLAAFDLVTISFSLYLNHRLIDLHDESVRVNLEWSERLNQVSDLAQLAGEVDAPGNDVFDSRDVEGESTRLRTKLALFERNLAEAETALFRNVTSAQTVRLREDLAVVREAMQEMVTEAERIFTYFRQGQPEKAGERMATMDRKYAKLNGGFAQLGRHIRGIQAENFHAQQVESDALRRYEYPIAGAIVLMVLAVAIYGYRMSRVMAAVMKEKEHHLRLLQEVRDGLERRVQERTGELQRITERFELAVAGTADGLWDWDVATNATFYSPRYKDLLGFTPDDPRFPNVYESFLQRLHPDDLGTTEQMIERSLADGRPYRVVCRLRTEAGVWRWFEAKASTFLDHEGRATRMAGSISDITERKQAETERLQFERKLQETQKLESLGVLAGGIAHDFNNLLTSILGNASLASLDLPLSSPAQENLENIKQGTQRAAELCKQMLAYSGKGKFVVQCLDLNRLVEETTHLLQLSISKKAVLRFNLHPALPAIEADATQIRQVIMNLVINASEAIGEKSGVITLNTGVTLVDQAYLGGTILAPELPDGTYVHLEVADTGCGMSPETQAKIFDPFFSTKFTGRGLGLAAVLGIVRGHKGTLRIYSELGRGTTFKLLFPCAAGAVTPESAEAGAANALWRGKGSVLLVDDEESVRSTAALMLRRLGFTVALAADGREAVAAFQAEPDRFTLVLMDLTMPHLDGEQAFTAMRRIRPNVQVVLMSGFNEQEAISRFTGKGLASFIQKPFQLELLSETLQAVLVGGARKAT